MSGNNLEGAEPNLTPMLDMVFQLVTFFMLVINFKGASMDLSLKLPVLGSARPLEYSGKLEPLLLNINTEGKVHAYGQVVAVEDYVSKEARLLKLQLESAGTVMKDKEFPIPVIVRADRNVTFKQLNNVIETCQKHGYRQFSLSAMTKEEGN
jgi:biopolymer transport protein ExbD